MGNEFVFLIKYNILYFLITLKSWEIFMWFILVKYYDYQAMRSGLTWYENKLKYLILNSSYFIVYGFNLKASLPFIVRSIDMFGVIQNPVLYISFLETHILWAIKFYFLWFNKHKWYYIVALFQ